MATRPWYILRLLKTRVPTDDDRRTWTECRFVGACKTLERVEEIVPTLEPPEGWVVDYYEVTRQTPSQFFGHFGIKRKVDWL